MSASCVLESIENRKNRLYNKITRLIGALKHHTKRVSKFEALLCIKRLLCKYCRNRLVILLYGQVKSVRQSELLCSKTYPPEKSLVLKDKGFFCRNTFITKEDLGVF